MAEFLARQKEERDGKNHQENHFFNPNEYGLNRGLLKHFEIIDENDSPKHT